MDTIFAKSLKTLLFGLFKPCKSNPSNLIFQNWDPSLFLLYDVKLYGKKIEKIDDPTVFHCRQMEKRIKPN